MGITKKEESHNLNLRLRCIKIYTYICFIFGLTPGNFFNPGQISSFGAPRIWKICNILTHCVTGKTQHITHKTYWGGGGRGGNQLIGSRNNLAKLIHFIFPWEKWFLRHQFSHYTSHRPHINSG